MNRLTAWLIRKTAAIDAAPTPVPGWLMQWVLIATTFALLWTDRANFAPPFIVGSVVIGVIRAIERDRRKAKAEAERKRLRERSRR